MSSAISYHRLRAPTEHGTALIEPPLARASDLLRDNQAIFQHDFGMLQGKSLPHLQRMAREELIQLAAAYTRTYHNVDLPTTPTPLFLTGHQPELFHPGVWLKNFVLSFLSTEYNALAINLLIDSHPVRQAGIFVPAGSSGKVVANRISLDQDQVPIPYEQRQCNDRETFDRFGKHVTDTIRPWIPEPMVKHRWPIACAALRETNNLGEALARFRHTIERQFGLTNLELPLSRICDTTAFWWFASHLLRHAPRLANSYNTALAEYRLAHHTRNSAQPLPDLRQQNDWYESPFWIWHNSRPTRQPLFVRQHANELELSNRDDFHQRLPLRLDGSAEKAVESWSVLRQQGWKIRPRALTTTLFARLLLGDLFIHGIGGAKYDQVTDRLMQLFWGVSPPSFLTVSATTMLPIKQNHVSSNDLQHVQLQLRELRFHPENFLPDDQSSVASKELTEAATWVKYKQDWIGRESPAENRRERHLAIERANAHLQTLVRRKREFLETEHTRLATQWQNYRVLASREHSFCLFPEDFLSQHLSHFCGPLTST